MQNSRTTAAGSFDLGAKIAEMLIAEGYLSEGQLRYAQRVLAKLPSSRTLLGVLLDLKYVTREQVREGLRGKPIAGPLGELLVELGSITRSDLELALNIQKEHRDKKLGEILVEHNILGEEKLLEILSHQFGIPHIDLASTEIEAEVLRLASLKEFRNLAILPIRREAGGILVAFGESFNEEQVRLARRILGSEILPGIARVKTIQETIDRIEKQQRGLETTQNENVIVEAVDSVLRDAIAERASDIHIEPMKRVLRVRFRIDGVLVPYKEFPLDMAPGMTSRIKILAGADIAEKRRHQDGRILFETGEEPLDIRVSCYVTVFGEKVVLRLLNKQALLMDLQEIGMFPRMLQMFREEALDAASGVVLVTGPTGSGKTTTLYSAVNYLSDIHVAITTAEDPVEYVIEGVAQCSLNPKIKVTYEETLRHIMRQDPDVIVIGEIRDRFSAEAAIQAALTGHKVLTTFHTEDSIGGLLRLLNMNIEAFLISSTVVSVVAQRLLRRVCPHCAEDHPLSPYEAQRLGYKADEFRSLVFKKGRGCGQCRYTGYQGRVAIFELLVLNELVKDALISKKTSYEIRRISTESAGLVTLLEDGIIKGLQGLTTFEEIMRQLPRLSKPRPISELRRFQGEV